jgi:hypothetical protein
MAAWCLKKPIVTTDFVIEGLAGRRSVRAPLPKEEDYTPEGGDGVVTTDSAKAEEAGNGPFGGMRDPLKGFIVISLFASESEGLVMAAGGSVYRAYVLRDDVFNEGTWLDELLAAEKSPIPSRSSTGGIGGTVVFIETTSRKVKLRRDFLRRRNIRGVAQKNFAMGINEMRGVLVDCDGKEVFGREGMPSSSFRLGWGGSEEERMEGAAKGDTPQESEAARLSTIQEVSREDVSRDEASEKPVSSESKKLPSAKEPPAPAPELVSTGKAAEATQEESPHPPGKRKRGGGTDTAVNNDADEAEAAEEPKNAKRTRTDRSAKKTEGPADDDGFVAADGDDHEPAPVEEQPSRSKRKRDEEHGVALPKKKRGGGKAAMEQDENEERIVESTVNPNDHRKPLPKKKNGWLSSAPKNAIERAKYKSTKADLEEIDVVFPSESAITVKKKGLVVRSDEECRARQAQMKAARGSGPRIVTGRDGKPVKDFKRFRKNVVIRSGGGGVRFRSVLPRESERQRQLEQMERDLEKSQREAEALFNGDDAGSIRSFFGSTAKKKKKSRSRR